MKTLEELQKFYEELKDEFVGYIQMSDKKLDDIFSTKQTLPSWDSLHSGKNFILEACLFDGDRSIMIRQIDGSFVVIDEKISSYENITYESFVAKSNEEKINLKANIAQIWEEEEDELCEGLKVLKPTIQLFSGFEKGENK
ncbi:MULTISPECIES: TIGR04423 family type III CRISPR-associated protein [Arcobacteraceae]|uniref:TIGR04423 family type III CRISPR-associated protein n=2 Tax=Arcobacteraceae TaxID=2808963 RepID=A0ABX2YAL6_9BACT|nr:MULTISPECIES: TIGR04423 family type III CRISPR-associated protein [Arcobacteraceae]OCL82273.1 hypothetical protein AAW30_01558 [Arcobacter porcinus]OCL90774.1 hypothetical protein AAX28_01591 [Arcobacter porcinus]OCL95814.1 hypothetical protein AA347_01296 [Aliarcobacter thereius LMG 24486]QBF16212.1 CRISPR/Cas system-associated RAMP protein, type III [Aliarcobacter thereius LMG 24486]TLS92163.1 TIGR04423 family type III CRISPR-associated protein [Aliarcobacter thereius]